MTKVATSIWEATLNKARQIYTAVVCLSRTYGATVWYSLSLSGRYTGSTAKLAIMQNKCLKTIMGAYKATNIKVLEAEARVALLNIHLNRIILRSKNTSRCSKIIKSTKARIRQKLHSKRGKKWQPKATPGLAKKEWAELKRERLIERKRLQIDSIGHEEINTSCSSWSKKWATQK